MDENTAIKIAREWLRSAEAPEDRLWVVTSALERITAEPDVHALAADGRLAVLAKKELWIGTLDLETDNATTVKIERVDLSNQRVRLSFAESHDLDPDKSGVTYTWRADFEHGPEPLEIRAQGRYVRGTVRIRDSDDPVLAFGWRLAEATGWQQPEEPFVEAM